MSKPTPGPWHQYDDAPVYGKDYAAVVWGPDGPGHGLVAHCSPYSIANQEQIANARLIAAAPSLLAACRDALAAMRDIMQGLPGIISGGLDDACLGCEAAIGNAEGTFKSSQETNQ